MTLATLLPRKRAARAALGDEVRLLRVDAETRIRVACRWRPEGRRAPAVVLVHGMCGSAESGYMLGAAESAYQHGFHAVRINIRNCGGTEALSPTLYHAGLTEDVEAAVRALRAEGVKRIHLIGFSLGGCMVLRFLSGGSAAAAGVVGAVVVSPALDLARCQAALDFGARTGLYRWYFLRRLKEQVLRKADLFPDRYETAGIGRIRTIRAFDDRFTAPCSGFRDAADYYERASALPHLGGIRAPVLVIQARDDGIVPFTERERAAIGANPALRLLSPDRGGHCAFVARDAQRFWAESVAVRYLAALEARASTEM